MNHKLQRISLEKGFKKKGVSPDLIDSHALIDRKLTLTENKTILNKKAKMLTNNNIGQESYGRLSSWELTEKAQDIQSNRTYKAQAQDDKIRARQTFQAHDITAKEFKKWKKKPNRFDIEGVDTRGSYF